ncbi:hypothetical protein D3C79_987580 [compost metagenome]
MLDDLYVAGLLRQAGVDLGAKAAELEHAGLGRTAEHRRSLGAFLVLGRKAHTHPAHGHACSARLGQRGGRMGQHLAAAHLLAHGRFAVSAVHMHQIVLHVENEIDRFHGIP